MYKTLNATPVIILDLAHLQSDRNSKPHTPPPALLLHVRYICLLLAAGVKEVRVRGQVMFFNTLCLQTVCCIVITRV